MNHEQSLDLYAKGKDAWNDWAAERLAERAALKTAGDWVESPIELEWNPETRDWHDAAKAEFSAHTFEDDAGFSGFEFPGAAWFRGATFKGGAGFRGATFEGAAWFDKATFEGGAGFGGATFRGNAGFVGATFRGDAGFEGATFEGGAGFVGATFRGYAWFAGATFRGSAGFVGATFRGRAGFEGATFRGSAGFVGATFRGRAWFGQSLFQGYTTFVNARFRQSADFKAARGERAFSLAGTEFREVPDFAQAHFEEAPRFDNLRIEPGGFQPYSQSLDPISSISGPDLAARWRSLKRLAIQGHDHTRELKFFRGEIKAGRGTEGNFWPSVFSYPYEWFSDFGGSVVRPLIWWVASVLLFTGFYLGEHLARSYHAVSGIGGSIARIFSFAGTSTLDLTCFAGEGEPWMAAFGLSFRKGLLFSGFDSTGKLSQAYGCLYGIYPKDESRWGGLPGSFSPVIPPFVSALGTVQMLLSSVLIFLFLLAVRNHFRIR